MQALQPVKGCEAVKKKVVGRRDKQLVGFQGTEDEYLVIPPEVDIDGERYRVEALGDYAFNMCLELRTVVILDGIKKWGIPLSAVARN